jgi:hypothetical protein
LTVREWAIEGEFQWNFFASTASDCISVVDTPFIGTYYQQVTLVVAAEDCRIDYTVENNNMDTVTFRMTAYPTSEPTDVEGSLVLLDEPTYDWAELRLEAGESVTFRMVESPPSEGFAWTDMTVESDDEGCVVLEDNNLGNYTTLYR